MSNAHTHSCYYPPRLTGNTAMGIDETIEWLQRLGRPALPECPIEAAKAGKPPKAPCYFNGKTVIPVNWSLWQSSQPSEKTLRIWFSERETGIGTLGGWNGKHWIGWIDFDQKNFASPEECDQTIKDWVDKYQLTEAPYFRTPSGGYRFLVAFTQEPKNFGANSKFSLGPYGQSVGELLCKNGAHTLLPPTVGVEGQYQWLKFREYPPVFDRPEEIGLYRAQDSGTQQKTQKLEPISTFSPYLLPHVFLATLIQRQLTVRIHSKIVSAPGATWAKLWYLLRALDIKGSGFYRINLAQVSQLLRVSASTIRQWLREGKAIGAFRWWRFAQKKGLRVALGSIYKVCLGLGLNSWGVVAEIPLHQAITCLRATTTAAVAQKEQQLSRFAAWRALPAEARKVYRLPQPEAFFDGSHRPSDNLPRGGIRCLIHIGQHRIFTSKGFIPFGVSQKSVAQERRLSDRTVRRHLSQLGIEKRQIVQAKSAYGEIKEALRWSSPGIAPEPDISMRRIGQAIILTEPSGHVGTPHSCAIRPERLFSYGDRHYIYRCNLYRPGLQLRSTRYSILNYKRLLKKRACPTLGTV